MRAFPYIRDDSAASPTLERAQPSHDTFQRFRVFEMRAVAPVVHAPRGAAPAPRRVRSASRNSILSRAAAEPLGSLVPDTLREMETDEEFKLAKERLETEGQAALTREERARSAELFHSLQSSGDDETTIEDIAQSDTLMRHENSPHGDDAAVRLPTLASETRSREHAARHPMHMPLSPSRVLVQLPSSKTS